jgi:hypothetical protein
MYRGAMTIIFLSVATGLALVPSPFAILFALAAIYHLAMSEIESE